LLNVIDKYHSQMSGVQQHRVALERALALSQDILLLDEQLSALDAKVREKFRREMGDLEVYIGVSTILVRLDGVECV
ncbi:putative 2-aminoethylphosphonate ABC transporter ATP-binding protein, partial [Bacillus cereus]|nr:putative 2-aminoethylphosphonate ABC transporter ATP-binding protein [Bacillus cereus]